jgi:hypothetical protein
MTDAQRKITPDEFKARFDTDEGSLAMLISFWLGLLGAADSILQLMKARGDFKEW